MMTDKRAPAGYRDAMALGKFILLLILAFSWIPWLFIAGWFDTQPWVQSLADRLPTIILWLIPVLFMLGVSVAPLFRNLPSRVVVAILGITLACSLFLYVSFLKLPDATIALIASSYLGYLAVSRLVRGKARK
jgi:hypothetical protein